MAHRQPPQFIEGEQAILGGLLIDNEAIPKVLATVSAEDLLREPHRIILNAITQLFNANRPVDWLTLTSELKRRGQLEAVGGQDFLAQLIDAIPSAANIMHYCDVVRDKALFRSLIHTCREIADKAYDQPESAAGLLDEAEAMIFGLADSKRDLSVRPVGDLMAEAFEKIESLYERKEHITGVPSGFHDLDLKTAGWQPSDLIIIAGRPSMGKTAFAINCGLHAAMECNIPTMICSLEMSSAQIALRLLCARARVNLNKVRTGYLTREDWSAITTAVGEISETPFFVDDTPGINTLEIRAKARRLKKERGLGLIIVDYLQLMESVDKGRGRRESREREISDISRSLKALAKELDVPVIALSQLNRKVEERPNKRPQLADLRESGAIEQDADVIIFIYRDEVYNKSEDNPKRGEAEIIIGKQRNGPVGTVTVAFHSHTSSFRPLVRREDEGVEAGNF